MKKEIIFSLILSISSITSIALTTCTKSNRPVEVEKPVEPKPEPTIGKELKPENYPGLIWIYDKNRWKHDTYNGGTAEYTWTNDENTPESMTLKVSTTKGVVCSNSWTQIVLKPNTIYKFSADVRTLAVTGEKGATITLIDEWWSTADYVKGTQQTTQIFRTFLTDNLGIAKLCLSLGVNGQTSSGTVYFSNIKVEEGDYSVFESKYLKFRVRQDQAKSVSESSINSWLKTLDRVYDEYIELVGANPYPGRMTEIYAPEPSISAWGFAGNPIQITTNGVISMLKSYEDKDDWSFGMMHEIGHNFNSGGEKFNNSDANWNWNDELFANFRMYYAVEKLNGVFSQQKLYKGSEAEAYYRTDASESYDNKIAKGLYSHDALMYTMIRVKNKIGWEPFKKLFREFYNNPNPSNYTNWQKFERFLDTLSKYAGLDVRESYTAEELQIIKDNI